ncbi:MAG: hypothetical protein ACREP1_14290 [Rhodanobacteraceae bacterium]
MSESVPLANPFRSAWELLARNWILVVPSVVVGIVTGVALFVLGAYAPISLGGLNELNGAGPGVFVAFIGSIAALAVRMLGAIVSIACTTGMAAAAWERGRTTFADGGGALRECGTQVFVAILLLFIVGALAAFLMDFTFYLTVLLYAIFALYTIPGVIVGRRTAVDALVESFRLAAKNFWTTFWLVLLVGVIASAGGIAGHFAWPIPALGDIFGLVVMELAVAYATVLIVGEYVALRPSLEERPDITPQ